jgi:hypothetical protein
MALFSPPLVALEPQDLKGQGDQKVPKDHRVNQVQSVNSKKKSLVWRLLVRREMHRSDQS